MQYYTHHQPMAYYPPHSSDMYSQPPQIIDADTEKDSKNIFCTLCTWMLSFVLAIVFTLSFSVFFVGVFCIALHTVCNFNVICPCYFEILMVPSFVAMVLTFLFGCTIARR